ncbi:MAG: GNAT family N-acetyltransferase [Acidobacteria bacterium]|nr:GNAT family N-acetyltransferase [Acidobacteriota bacterium]MCA1640079.1 GNAT family N-acetyltransferase [Acidobacteriota bacterium]
MKIRKAGLSDLRELRDIGIKSYLPHYAQMWKSGGVEWYMNRCFGDEVLQNELGDTNVEYYIISSEQENIGVLKLVLRKTLPDSNVENALYLEKIYFVKEWTGKGIGREFLNFAFDRAKELNCDYVWLVAMDTAEKPIAAYQKAGFSIHSRKRLDFELLKDEYKGTFVMKKYFKTNAN